MRLERASAYGMLALVYMANHVNGSPAQVHQIAAATNVPVEYLRKLLGRLSRARIIQSIRGRHGGFRLAQTTGEITVLRIIEAIEGPIDPAAFFDDDLVLAHDLTTTEQIQRWRRHTASQLRHVLAQTTLADILRPHAPPSPSRLPLIPSP